MSRVVKAIAAGAGAAAAILESAYPSWRWLPAVTAAITAAVVYLAPNRPPKPPA